VWGFFFNRKFFTMTRPFSFYVYIAAGIVTIVSALAGYWVVGGIVAFATAVYYVYNTRKANK